MNKELNGLSMEALDQHTLEELQAQSVTAVLLALGSNYHAEEYLPIARSSLADLGEIQVSTAFQNPDFTATVAQPKPDYTNQCVYLLLTAPMNVQQLQHTFKAFEGDCHRCRETEPKQIRRVTMDIDILLVKLEQEKNSLSKKSIPNKSMENWIVMADRYPFKAHETAGINELVAEGFL